MKLESENCFRMSLVGFVVWKSVLEVLGREPIDQNLQVKGCKFRACGEYTNPL